MNDELKADICTNPENKIMLTTLAKFIKNDKNEVKDSI
jgi:hypothetical protein